MLRFGSVFVNPLFARGWVRQASSLGNSRVPAVTNEPAKNYAPGSAERQNLKNEINRILNDCPEIPCIVGGKEIRTGSIVAQRMPTNHSHKVCTFHEANEEVIRAAVESCRTARHDWENLPKEDRWAVFLKAADLLSTKYRAELCAAVMVGTSKNVWQAEIDAALETIDFWRFNVKYAWEIYNMQPPENSFGVWNRQEYRPLDGFVLAISPFNFIAIGSNLHSSPNLMGNTSIWKPASTTMLGSYIIYKILTEAGLPPGVLNFVPASGEKFSRFVADPQLGGLHFTGSTAVFNTIWRNIANNLDNMKCYPRIVGETGGKNFHFVHESADIKHAVTCTVRGAFEYQGQKCSATSRLYVPSNLWPEFKKQMVEVTQSLKMGCVTEFDTFVGAVIDDKAFKKITSYIDRAKKSNECKIIAGGNFDNSKGYFIEPTIIETTNPKYETMVDELFGPVLSVYVYDPNKIDETIQLCDTTSAYGLCGAIFAQDRAALTKLTDAFRYTAGNFYVNDKSTGAVVGQQPFGGGRASGTNDKSGSALNLLRWTSVRSIKENFLPVYDVGYPHMQGK